VIAIVAGLVGCGIGVAIVYYGRLHTTAGQVAWPLGLWALGALIGWVATGFNHHLTYVGKEGIARFVMSGTRENVKRTELFLFKDAAELRTGQTRRFVNGVYQGTDYNFKWTSDRGDKICTLSGTYHSKEGTPKTDSPYHYACSAEVAWSMHFIRRANAEIDRAGSIKFAVGSGDWIGVGKGFLDLTFKGQTARCDAKDVANISIANGVFSIKRKDAKVGWFSSTGVFSFAYVSMANARVFLMALDQLVGIRFS
jgi:hypothetical protein